MNVLRFSAEADAGGIIHLDIPVGGGGNYDVQVVVSPKPSINGTQPTESSTALGWPADYFEKVFDSIQDPTFQRGDQGEYEAREHFE